MYYFFKDFYTYAPSQRQPLYFIVLYSSNLICIVLMAILYIIIEFKEYDLPGNPFEIVQNEFAGAADHGYNVDLIYVILVLVIIIKIIIYVCECLFYYIVLYSWLFSHRKRRFAVWILCIILFCYSWTNVRSIFFENAVGEAINFMSNSWIIVQRVVFGRITYNTLEKQNWDSTFNLHQKFDH